MFEQMIMNMAKTYMKKYNVKLIEVRQISIADTANLTVAFEGKKEVITQMRDYLNKFKKEVENDSN
jgi:hypothetical protein